MNEYFDLSLLDAPVSEALPAGEDLRDDASPSSPYYLIKDTRNAARTNERKRIDNGETSYFEAHDWAPVLEHAPEIITQKSKDLEIASWYIEGLCRSAGFEGLAFGFKVAETLIKDNWGNLFPQPDEDGIATRIGPLSGLNGYGSEGTLIMPIKSIPLFVSEEGTPINGWQCQQAFELERLTDPDKKQNRIDAGWIEKSTLDIAVRNTSIEELRSNRDGITLAIDAYAALASAIDAVCQEDPQPTSNITTTLKEILEIFDFVAGAKLEAASQVSDTAETDVDAPTSEASGSNDQHTVADFTMDNAGDYLTQRKAALRTLSNVAHFFRQHEPHSPISYALEKAVKWSDMPLPDLLKELIADDGARQEYFRVTGITDEE